MDLERWRKLSVLYYAARARPQAERSAFLESESGGDEELRREVESLIAHDADTLDSFIRPDATFGNYRIERPLGSGGMGSVFLAYDAVLRRRVALKIIHASDDAEASRARLLREARSAAALNHPNICVIHEVGDANGTAFIAMEYVEGRSLRERLDDGPLPLEEVIRYGGQAADALAHAHEHGVIHRDFKAANAIVTSSGWLKVVDFGLARRGDALMAQATTMASLVPAGIVAGTPYAMAPEQVRGESADERSDIWALGVLLYEMATGERPFPGDTTAEVFSSILRDAPSALPASVPAELAAAIAKCLEKEPARRFPSARDVRIALDRVQPAATASAGAASGQAPDRRRVYAVVGIIVVVVLAVWSGMEFGAPIKRLSSRLLTASNRVTPGDDVSSQQPVVVNRPVRRSVGLLGFRNVSGRPDAAYISTALDEGLGSDLANGDRLRIVSNEEIARLKRDLHLAAGDTLAPDTLRLVKAGLDIDVVVTGSYTAVGPDDAKLVRVDIRVQDTGTGQLIGTLSASHTEAELLKLISESGTGVRRALGLTGVDANTFTAALPMSLDARRLYAEGLNALRAFDAKRARDLFERSVTQEPDFALAHIALANAWSILGYDAQAARESAAAMSFGKGLRRADRMWIEGLVREYTREWGSAIAAYRTLVHDYPDQPEYALKLADAQTSAGAPKEALATLATLAKTVPAARGDPRVLLAEASAAEALGDATHEESAAAAAIAAAQRQNAALLVARSSIALGWSQQQLGKTAAAKETNETARRLFEEAGDRRGVARALIQLGALARESGDLPGAERTLRTALDISRDVGNKRQTSQSLNELANVFFRLRRFGAAADMYGEAVAVSREIGDQGAEARALGNLASVRYEQGNVTEANRLDREALTIKRAIGDQRSISFSLINIAETAADLGNLDDAQKMYEESRVISEKLKAKAPLAYSLSGLSLVALRRDQLPLAQAMIEQALALRKETNDAEGVLDAEVSLANILLERRDIAAASDALTRMADALNAAPPEQAARGAVVRAAILRSQGRPREGRTILSAAMKRSTEGFSAATGVAIDLEDARLLAALGEMAAAAQKARQVAARNHARGLVAFELEADLVLASISADSTALSAVAQRARTSDFALIARKAETLPRSRGV